MVWVQGCLFCEKPLSVCRCDGKLRSRGLKPFVPLDCGRRRCVAQWIKKILEEV